MLKLNNMKLYRIPVLLLIIVCSLASCKKFLNTIPPDSLSPLNYYKTRADIERALAGVYDRLQDNRVYGECIPTNLSFSDEFFYARSVTGINANFIDASTLEVNRNYESLYTGIERANMLLENVDGADADSVVKREIKGQALFLRAYYLYILTDMYGDVPLKLHSSKSPGEAPLPQTPSREILEQVVNDMKTSLDLVPSFNYGGKVSKSAVQGILARVYLKIAGFPFNDTEKFADAKSFCESLISSGNHELNPDYKQIFINHTQDKYEVKESIWEVEFYGNNSSQLKEAGRIGVINGIYCTDLNIGYGYDMIRVTPKLFNAYDSNDLRRDWCVAPYIYQTVNSVTSKKTWNSTQIFERNPGKWRREYELYAPKAKDGGPTNFPLLRYSDVLLMHAEAENELNGPTEIALNSINQVRRRAYNVPVNTPDAMVDIPSGISQEELRQEIRNERFREFAFEGMRKHDLIRWGIYVNTMQDLAAEIDATAPTSYKYASTAAKNVAERSVLFPIPNSELGVNKNIVQNPGW